MPVPHDLYADLGKTKEEVAKLQQTNSRLGSLITKYEEMDRQVLGAENASAADDELVRLKKQRAALKEEIVQQIEDPNSKGAAKRF